VVLSVSRVYQNALYPSDGIDIGAFAVHRIRTPWDEPRIPRRPVNFLRRSSHKVSWINVR
jgi:hypothetical protein